VMNFYSLCLTRHKGFLAAISRFFSHPQDTRSYPPGPAVFPPSYPQIRPQTVEFPDLSRFRNARRLRAWPESGVGSRAGTRFRYGPSPGSARGLGPGSGMARVRGRLAGWARFRAWPEPGPVPVLA